MYADRADEIISNHNSSKPLFLMVAFQVRIAVMVHVMYDNFAGIYILHFIYILEV